jgi:hypothetical protein
VCSLFHRSVFGVDALSLALPDLWLMLLMSRVVCLALMEVAMAIAESDNPGPGVIGNRAPVLYQQQGSKTKRSFFGLLQETTTARSPEKRCRKPAHGPIPAFHLLHQPRGWCTQPLGSGTQSQIYPTVAVVEAKIWRHHFLQKRSFRRA